MLSLLSGCLLIVAAFELQEEFSIGKPEQIHISQGIASSEINVQWATLKDIGSNGKPGLSSQDAFVNYGLSPTNLSKTTSGSSFFFQDFGDSAEHRGYFIHIATIKELVPNTVYYYSVGGNSSGWSKIYQFKSQPITVDNVKERLPMVYAVFGDQGDYNGQTLPSLVSAASTQELDIVLHVGDFAYDLHTDNGRNGDAWMRDVEPIAAVVPYMVCPGNHEASQNFNHYTQRFRNMPSNTGTLTFPEFATAPNNWWYSWDSGLLHIVSISTEVYFSQLDLVPQQWSWLEKDLAAVNRMKTPWLVVMGHRPLYCSGGGDCDHDATTNRMGIDIGTGDRAYGLEELFYTHGVDLYLAGHEHNYERMYDIAPLFNVAEPWLSGITTKSTYNPTSTTHITTGSAGNVEDHDPFERPAPERTAKRLLTYGWSKMSVFNDTHILWQQIQTDKNEPSSTWGTVVDETWIIQHHHGPFKNHPRASSIIGAGVSGLDERSFVQGSVEETSRSAGFGCTKNWFGQLSCRRLMEEQAFSTLGRWQYTKQEARMDTKTVF